MYNTVKICGHLQKWDVRTMISNKVKISGVTLTF